MTRDIARMKWVDLVEKYLGHAKHYVSVLFYFLKKISVYNL